MTHRSTPSIAAFCEEEKSYSINPSVYKNDRRSEKFFLSYRLCEYILRKLATDQAFGGLDAEILCYGETSYMKPQQYGSDLVAKPCKAADEYDEDRLMAILSIKAKPL